jgi:hypothetical protein
MGVAMARYSIFIRSHALQEVWQVMQNGGFTTDGVAVIGTSRRTGCRVPLDAGGVRLQPGRDLVGRCMSFAELVEIALGRAGGESLRVIAA